jgi:small subunit ribosomal protein S6
MIGTAASRGSTTGSPPSRGQATTTATSPATPATRPTLPHRTRPRMLRVGVRDRWFAPTLLAWPAAMATEQPIYDLILLLDPEAEEERRTNILASLEQIIDRQGSIVSRHDWGLRPTAYEVRKRGDADYHLLQFQGTPELLNQLNHALKITDGVNRFRIIKLRKGTPEPPDLRASAVAAAAAEQPQPAEIER